MSTAVTCTCWTVTLYAVTVTSTGLVVACCPHTVISYFINSNLFPFVTTTFPVRVSSSHWATVYLPISARHWISTMIKVFITIWLFNSCSQMMYWSPCLFCSSATCSTSIMFTSGSVMFIVTYCLTLLYDVVSDSLLTLSISLLSTGVRSTWISSTTCSITLSHSHMCILSSPYVQDSISIPNSITISVSIIVTHSVSVSTIITAPVSIKRSSCFMTLSPTLSSGSVLLIFGLSPHWLCSTSPVRKCSSSSTPLSYLTVSTTPSHTLLSSPHLSTKHSTSISVSLPVNYTSFRTFLSIYCSGFHCFALIFTISTNYSTYLSIFYFLFCTFISPTIIHFMMTLTMLISFTLMIFLTLISLLLMMRICLTLMTVCYLFFGLIFPTLTPIT